MKQDNKTIQTIVFKIKAILGKSNKVIRFYDEPKKLTIEVEKVDTTTIYKIVDDRSESRKKARIIADLGSDLYCEWSGYISENEILDSLNN